MSPKFTILTLAALALLAVTSATPVSRQDTGGAPIVPSRLGGDGAADAPAATTAPESGDLEEADASGEPSATSAPESGACLARDAMCGGDRGECCGGTTCTPAPWMGAGMSACLPTPPSCYNEGQRNTGADGQEYVPYAPCCQGLVEKEMPEMGYGKFCVREGADAPVTVAPAEATPEAGAGDAGAEATAAPEEPAPAPGPETVAPALGAPAEGLGGGVMTGL